MWKRKEKEAFLSTFYQECQSRRAIFLLNTCIDRCTEQMFLLLHKVSGFLMTRISGLCCVPRFLDSRVETDELHKSDSFHQRRTFVSDVLSKSYVLAIILNC
ncbi:hypothetical protein CRENBAI_024873 [Crenichthys baileyi]|uniref:Uncharacterized protein n=1 Tax=Crenichthys baileyi TaxID=28760 RepID=A0AAV9RPI6_9TELE